MENQENININLTKNGHISKNSKLAIIKDKEKFDDNNNDIIDDMEGKTVEEIYNYINSNNTVKNKKKKKSRRNRKNKNEVIKPEKYKQEEEVEDSIVLQFKEEINSKFIHAKNVKKIKPVLSEKWIQSISTYEY